MEENNESVKDQLKRIESKLEGEQQEKKKEKFFKLPWKAKVKPKAVSKGWATIQILKNNGSVDFVKKQVDEDGCIDIDGFPRIASADYRLIHKNTPFYIIPEWSMKPISLVDTYADSERDKMNIVGRRVILSKLEKEQIKPKKQMGSGIWWIIGAIVVIGGIYYFMKNGGLH